MQKQFQTEPFTQVGDASHVLMPTYTYSKSQNTLKTIISTRIYILVFFICEISQMGKQLLIKKRKIKPFYYYQLVLVSWSCSYGFSLRYFSNYSVILVLQYMVVTMTTSSFTHKDDLVLHSFGGYLSGGNLFLHRWLGLLRSKKPALVVAHSDLVSSQRLWLFIEFLMIDQIHISSSFSLQIVGVSSNCGNGLSFECMI